MAGVCRAASFAVSPFQTLATPRVTNLVRGADLCGQTMLSVCERRVIVYVQFLAPVLRIEVGSEHWGRSDIHMSQGKVHAYSIDSGARVSRSSRRNHWREMAPRCWKTSALSKGALEDRLEYPPTAEEAMVPNGCTLYA